jgi:hypothetical protein
LGKNAFGVRRPGAALSPLNLRDIQVVAPEEGAKIFN